LATTIRYVSAMRLNIRRPIMPCRRVRLRPRPQALTRIGTLACRGRLAPW
jgi:hypothetical protein